MKKESLFAVYFVAQRDESYPTIDMDNLLLLLSATGGTLLQSRAKVLNQNDDAERRSWVVKSQKVILQSF